MVARASERAGKAEAGEKAAEPGYDALVARLEKVVEALEAGDLPLEASVERFAEGVQLARDASRRLDEAERRVELLVKAADGGEATAPLDGGEDER
jgi:exodeoxyribonuclease VII small subunit